MISTLERRYILFLLFAVSVFNYIDRTILSILQIPIKAELHLSDAQLGALTGLAFAIFYAVLGVPLGRLADHMKRKYLIAGALTVWSGMTAMTGLANSFASLVGFRIGVAAGEAGSIPASHSMISDLYPQNARATAISIFGLSLPVGMLIGYLSAGWLATEFGWRKSFAVAGIAGLILVPIILLTMKEPRRGRFDPVSAVGENPPPFKEALGILWSKKAFRYLVMAGSFHAYAWYTVNAWNAPFYNRVHGMSLGDVSNYLALINGVCSALGMFGGAWLADHFGKKDPRGRARVVAVALFILVPIALAQYLVDSALMSQILGGLSQMMMLVYYGPIVALCHSLMPPKMRGLTSAVLALILSLIGAGLGPWVTGILSDIFTAHLGAHSNALGFALCTAVLGSLVSAVLFWRASNLMPLEMLRDEPAEPVELQQE